MRIQIIQGYRPFPADFGDAEIISVKGQRIDACVSCTALFDVDDSTTACAARVVSAGPDTGGRVPFQKLSIGTALEECQLISRYSGELQSGSGRRTRDIIGGCKRIDCKCQCGAGRSAIPTGDAVAVYDRRDIISNRVRA